MAEQSEGDSRETNMVPEKDELLRRHEQLNEEWAKLMTELQELSSQMNEAFQTQPEADATILGQIHRRQEEIVQRLGAIISEQSAIEEKITEAYQ